jgi:hypothetical protein
MLEVNWDGGRSFFLNNTIIYYSNEQYIVEIEERLDMQRDTRTFMTREGVRPFPARTTS